MKYHTLILSKSDHQSILDVIDKAALVDPVQKKSIEKLKGELLNAEIREPGEMPEDVVRLGSLIDILTPIGKKDELELVLPEEGDFLRKKLSILSPMGAALIGYAKGDAVTWPLRIGEEVIVIEEVVNPESTLFRE